jgi:EAL domain-containing protein (putative c-di-GMP-specific phosphodiesterase class I)
MLQALREIGVDYAQGYAVGKPKPFNSHGNLMRVRGANVRREVA